MNVILPLCGEVWKLLYLLCCKSQFSKLIPKLKERNFPPPFPREDRFQKMWSNPTPQVDHSNKMELSLNFSRSSFHSSSFSYSHNRPCEFPSPFFSFSLYKYVLMHKDMNVVRVWIGVTHLCYGWLLILQVKRVDRISLGLAVEW